MVIKDSWKKILPFNEWKKIQKQLNPSLVYPQKDLLFDAFSYCEIEDVHTVIMQTSPNTKLPFGYTYWSYDNSLSEALYEHTGNIVIEEFIDPSLKKWVKDGILLVNAALTSPIKGNKREHLNIWKDFTTTYISKIDKKDRNFIFIGSDAKRYSVLIKKGNKYVYNKWCKEIFLNINYNFDESV